MDAGEKFYRQAKRVLEQFNHAVGEVKNLKQQPMDTLRIATALMFSRRHAPLVPHFLEQYPGIVVEHYLSDSQTDLIQEGIDVSIRMGEQKDSSHQARKIAMGLGFEDLKATYPVILGLLERIEALAAYDRSYPPHWRST